MTVPIVVSSMYSTIAGLMSGSVIRVSSWRGDAPSTVAASLTSWGTPSSAAANRIIAKAIPRQMLTTMIASIALSWSQATGAKPASPMTRLTVP